MKSKVTARPLVCAQDVRQKPDGLIFTTGDIALVFIGTHDGQNPAGDRRVKGIGRAELTGAVVAINLPEVGRRFMHERSEVVLPIRIAIGVEFGERGDASHDGANSILSQRRNARCDDDPPADECAAEGVVELGNRSSSIHWCSRGHSDHVAGHALATG